MLAKKENFQKFKGKISFFLLLLFPNLLCLNLFLCFFFVCQELNTSSRNWMRNWPLMPARTGKPCWPIQAHKLKQLALWRRRLRNEVDRRRFVWKKTFMCVFSNGIFFFLFSPCFALLSISVGYLCCQIRSLESFSVGIN
jgi:hypothetical protein